MIKKAPVLILIFLLLYTISYSQVKELKLITDGKYVKAYNQLIKKYNKSPESIPVNYLLARVYHQEGFLSYSIRKAYDHIKATDRFYTTFQDSLEKEKYKIYYNITPLSIRAECNIICKKAFDIAVSENTIFAYEHFIDSYPDSPELTHRATDIRDSLVFQQVEIADSYDAYFEFAEKYPGSRQYPIAKDRYERILFKNKTADGTPGSYYSFIGEHPENSYRSVAEDSVFRFVKNNNTISNLEDFIENVPAGDHTSEAYHLLYNKYNWDGELVTLQKFLKKYPGFCDTTSYFRKDLKLANYAWEIDLAETMVSGLFKMVDKDAMNYDMMEFLKRNFELNRRLQREKAKTGALQFSLMWNNFNDLDLHCIDPVGEEIFYKHKTSASGGELDVDMNWVYGGGKANDTTILKTMRCSDRPVENIYWNKGNVPSGRYRVYINYTKNFGEQGCEDPTNYVLRLKYNNKFREFTGSLTYSKDSSLYLIHELNYSPPEPEPKEGLSEKALANYDKYIRAAAPKELAWVAVHKIIEKDLQKKNYDKAVETINKYKTYFSGAEIYSRIEETVKLIEADDPTVIKTNVGIAVNTKGNEYSPVITADDSTLFFCGKNREDNLGKEDIYYSTADIHNREKWTNAQLVDGINTETGNEAPMSVSFDGNTMLIFLAGDIYYCEKTSGGWADPERFPYPVNTDYWEGDAMLSSDGQAIIFASARPGGYNLHTDQDFYHGDFTYASDIYVCTRTKTGWSDAVNPGISINTAFCERSPFLHPDMKTMFFSSDGHYGLGKLDVYKVTRLSETDWTQWSKPVNLGRSINTPDADWGHYITTSGEYSYYSANNTNKINKEDIYRLTLPDHLKPDIVTLIRGKVIDTKGNPIIADIYWEDLTENKPVGQSGTDPDNGTYLIILPAGKLYGYFAEKEGYYPISKNIDLREHNTYTEIIEKITMISIEEISELKSSIKINNVFFDSDKAVLKPESYPELNRMADMIKEILKNEPGISIEIMGHTDNSGAPEHNQKLSEDRAAAVYKYLISAGIDKDIMSSVGFGEDKPVDTNDTEQGRQNNRRVEFRFIK